MENLTVVLPTRALKPDGIAKGRVSASNQRFLHLMPRIPPDEKSTPFLAKDAHGRPIHHLMYEKRKSELRPKQTITGLKHFFQEHGLQPGDRITVYKEEGNEVMLMGTPISSALYIWDESSGHQRGKKEWGGTVEGGEQSDYGHLLVDQIGEGRRGADDRWNGGKEDLVSNRAAVMRPSGRVQRKESREVGGVVEPWGSPLPAPQPANIKAAALCCVVVTTVAF
ncbi:hypothetical protein SLEP1_g40444 [Rubroshorea leprosula]|uniref:Uncharacterized protein n=1 Tax=Rubroshorea leprosula TaxID=152421 RepID=A0AAV5L4A4_9ROSI|nr:hypothetical protein SLEP1_g40444 [Rubroshorea leprosula]